MSENKKEQEIQDESNYWSTSRVNELLRKADEEGLDFKSVENPFHDNNPEFKRANNYKALLNSNLKEPTIIKIL